MPANDDDTQGLLRESVRSFLEKEREISRVRDSRQSEPGFDRGCWRTMGENGWLGILLPEEAGGFGLGFAEASIVAEEIGRTLAPEPFVASMVLAAGALRGCENAALEAELMPLIGGGELVPALAWQEANGEYDPAKIATRAEPSGAGFRLSGQKQFIPAAAGADVFLVTAATPEGVGLFTIQHDAPGVSLSLVTTTDAVAQGRLQLDDVRVESSRVASAKDAAPAVTRAVDEARLCASAELTGVMSRALELTLDYVKQRVQFGQTLGSFQVLQHRLVDLFIQQELARNTLAQSVAVFDETGDPHRRASAASAAKARSSEAGLRITTQAIQLHGGIGFTDECDIGLFLKRSLVLSAWLGNARAHRKRFGEMAPLAHGEEGPS